MRRGTICAVGYSQLDKLGGGFVLIDPNKTISKEIDCIC